MKPLFQVLLAVCMLLLILVPVCVYFLVDFGQSEQSTSPHIVFILADDLGWNDVSFHGASDIPTPNIDALGLNGIILNNYYGEWLCTPSRGALLTGFYPMRLGLQHHVILAGEATGLPLNVDTLPQYLKGLGYATHIVGKWHLGYQNTVYNPIFRGFDTFFGYLNGYIDYYDYTHSTKTSLKKQPEFFGIDLYSGTDVVRNFRGEYATKVFGEYAKGIIMKHDISQPLFLYLPHLAIHTGNPNQPLQAPPEIIAKFKYIKDEKRRIHAAKITSLDNAVGQVFETLSRRNMLKDSIVVFASDNGGQNDITRDGHSSNYPLRGNKYTAWEGGVHLPAVVWSPRFNLSKPMVSQHLMHVTDWLPTLYTAAGGNVSDLRNIDGINMWEALKENASSPRTDLLNVLDPIHKVAALRSGDFKLVNGSTGGNDLWYGPTSTEYIGTPVSMYNWVFRNGSVVKDILKKEGWWISEDPDAIYNVARIACESNFDKRTQDCKPKEGPCLFNIAEDPCEYHNIAKKQPKIVESMLQKIQAFEQEQVAPQSKAVDYRADPVPPFCIRTLVRPGTQRRMRFLAEIYYSEIDG